MVLFGPVFYVVVRKNGHAIKTSWSFSDSGKTIYHIAHSMNQWCCFFGYHSPLSGRENLQYSCIDGMVLSWFFFFGAQEQPFHSGSNKAMNRECISTAKSQACLVSLPFKQVLELRLTMEFTAKNLEFLITFFKEQFDMSIRCSSLVYPYARLQILLRSLNIFSESDSVSLFLSSCNLPFILWDAIYHKLSVLTGTNNNNNSHYVRYRY